MSPEAVPLRSRKRARVRQPPPVPPPPGVRFVDTKLRPPRLREDVIARARLVDVLHHATGSVPLTLISAPAGYGKTTLLAALQREHPEIRLAWISLDEEDNDPNVFAAALVAAIRRADPRLGAEAQGLLPGVSGLPRVILDLLINEIVALHPSPLVLVLDDFHRIVEPSIPRAIEYLIDRLPPQMHLVIATRQDPPLPLPRLRVRNQVAELRLDDLRFSEAESRALLNDRIGLAMTPEHISLLQQRTEGWPAGLSLMVAALRRLPGAIDRDAFLDHLVQLDRYVFDFLAAEVLHSLAAGERQFLLDVSVLGELSPELCAAVTQREDAPQALLDLYGRSLFVMALDQPATTFRFHDLFRDFLRHTLEREQPERARELHRRAGFAEPVFSRAVAHLLAAEAWNDAAQLIEERGESTLREGALVTLKSWIDALPTDVLDAHPRLSYLLGVAAWTRFDFQATIAHLGRAADGFRARGDHAGAGPVLVVLSNAYAAIGEFARAGELTEEASQVDLPMASRLSLLIQETWLDMADGKPQHAVEAFDAALDLIEAANDPELIHSLARGIHCYLFSLPGATARIERFIRIALPHARERSPLRASVLTMRAWSHQWRGRSSEAASTALLALEIADHLGGMRSTSISVHLLRAVLAALRNDARVADASIEALFVSLKQDDAAPFTDAWLAGYLVTLGRIRLMQGRLDEARAAEQRIRTIENLREWPIAPVARAMFRGMIAEAEERFADAEESFREAVRLQERIHIGYFAGDARTLLAALLYGRGRLDEALETFAPVLGEHAADATPGAVAWAGPAVLPLLRLARERGVQPDLASAVLELFGERVEQPSVVTPTGEALSPRELEVLRLVSEGASNAAVGEKLGISVHTVKRHVANLLQKLAVSSRAEAGAVARRIL
jgi:LuxR family maltose regulon positive regulatory protein